MGLLYMDGLVSTGNQIPITILERVFPETKKSCNYFIHIFFMNVDLVAITTMQRNKLASMLTSSTIIIDKIQSFETMMNKGFQGVNVLPVNGTTYSMKWLMCYQDKRNCIEQIDCSSLNIFSNTRIKQLISTNKIKEAW